MSPPLKVRSLTTDLPDATWSQTESPERRRPHRDLPFREIAVHVVMADFEERCRLANALQLSGLHAVEHQSCIALLDGSKLGPNDCVLVDLAIPNPNGLVLIQALRAGFKLTPFIFMTNGNDAMLAVDAMKKGAYDVVTTDIDFTKLLSLIKTAVQQRLVLAEMSRSADTSAPLVESLSAREQEILTCIVGGMPNKTIAWTLALSIRTVECHRARIMEKLGCSNFYDLLKKVIPYYATYSQYRA